MADQDKAERILDAAEALLLRTGYHKVSVAEVADRAAVGKGTVYLYWPSKAELFGAVLIRESAQQLDELIAALHADPAECRLHRTVRTQYTQVMRRPLARAMYTRDQDVLGELLTAGEGGAAFMAGKAEATVRYLSLLYHYGLLADDPSADPMMMYRLSTTMAGAFMLEAVPDVAELDVTAKAEALATTLRRAFEPVAEPTRAVLRTAAADLIEIYQAWRKELAEYTTRRQP